MRHRFYTIGYGMTIIYMVEFILDTHLYIIEVSRTRKSNRLEITSSEIGGMIRRLYRTDLTEDVVREEVEKLDPLKWSYKKIEK